MASSTSLSPRHCETSSDHVISTNSILSPSSASASVCRPSALSKHLEWIERGSSLIRRMNLERIAEDGRIRRLLMPAEYEHVENEQHHQPQFHSDNVIHSSQNQRQSQSPGKSHDQCITQTKDQKPDPDHVSQTEEDKEEEKPSEDALDQVQDQEQDQDPRAAMSAATSTRPALSEDLLTSSTSLLSWTFLRVHSTLQNSIQDALFSRSPEENFWVAIAPRLFCVSPMYINVFDRLFSSANLNRTWPAAEQFLAHLDASLSKQFQGKACVFDCGLFDGIKRVLHRSLLYDEFCDGKVSSIQFSRTKVPSMHSLFIVASTVSSWLELDKENIAVLVAPNNDHAAVFSTCCAIYCTNTLPIPERFGTEFLTGYQKHMHGAEGWGSKLQRTFSGLDAKTSTYHGTIPRYQERVVTDFIKLLEIRDAELLRKRKKLGGVHHKLTGVAVLPAVEEIHINKIVLLSCAMEAGIIFNYRPYFVLQTEKGVVYSSMVNIVRSISLAEGPHMYPVRKSIQGRDLLLRMYHLPFGRKGELILTCRLHIGLLLQALAQRALDKKTPVHETIGELTLTLARGDYDAITTTRFLPRDFAVQIFYSRDESAFPDEQERGSLASSASLDEETKENSLSQSPPRPGAPTQPRSSSPGPSSLDEWVSGSAAPGSGSSSTVSIEDDDAYRAAMASMASLSTGNLKPCRYQGPNGISFLISNQPVQTVFGNARVFRIDVTRKVDANQIVLSLLFHVRLGTTSSSSSLSQEVKVLPYRHLFRYLLPVAVRFKLVEMGATEESLTPHLPLFFSTLTGSSLDGEYAKWLQKYFNTEQNDGGAEYDGEFLRDIPVREIEPSDTYRIVSVPVVTANSARSASPPPGSLRGTARGASSTLISQLPTYLYSAQKPKADITTPDCLICRCAFIEAEEIKSLPCFHSYHSECIDSWLCLNKVCPVCQYNVENCSGT